MNSGDWLLLITACLIVGFRALTFRRFVWDVPLHHGDGFFLGVEVPPGFYRVAEGAGWLRKYHLVVTMEHMVEALALLTIFVSGRWSLVPAWAGGGAVLLTSACLGFTVYARSVLGANPPVRSSVAVPLVERRLGDYISWPVEALMLVVLAGGWALLLFQGDAQTHWSGPILITYVIAGLFPFKVGMVHTSYPIPAEQAEKHLQWVEAYRFHSLQVMDMMRWLLLACFGGYALLHGWAAAAASGWVRWLLIAVALSVGLLLMRVLVRGQGKLVEMGRMLRPVGSWKTPFRPAALMSSRLAMGFGVWFAGLVLLMVLLER